MSCLWLLCSVCLQAKLKARVEKLEAASLALQDKSSGVEVSAALTITTKSLSEIDSGHPPPLVVSCLLRNPSSCYPINSREGLLYLLR
jgi:hypothetical protein